MDAIADVVAEGLAVPELLGRDFSPNKVMVNLLRTPEFALHWPPIYISIIAPRCDASVQSQNELVKHVIRALRELRRKEWIHPDRRIGVRIEFSDSSYAIV